MSGSHRVAIYGLVVECDWPIHGVRGAAPGGPTAVRVRRGWPEDAGGIGDAPHTVIYRSEVTEGAVPALVADRPRGGDRIRLTYADGIRFLVAADGTEVWCDWSGPLTEEDADTFLLGPVLGLVLRLRGELALHASAVVRNGAAWAFVGPGGSGKSTLALALAREGFTLLTEDVLVLRELEGRWFAWPGYDHLRLWPDSPALRTGEADALRALSPTWPKRALDVTSAALTVADAPVPLAGCVFLADARGTDEPPGSIIERVRGRATLQMLVENAYMSYLLDLPTQGGQLQALSAASRGIAAYRLAPSWVAGALPTLVREVTATIADAVTSGGPR